MVEQWNNDGGTVEQIQWNSGTMMVQQRNSYGREMVEQWNNDGATEEQLWWNSGTMMVEQWKRYGGTVQQ